MQSSSKPSNSSEPLVAYSSLSEPTHLVRPVAIPQHVGAFAKPIVWNRKTAQHIPPSVLSAPHLIWTLINILVVRLFILVEGYGLAHVVKVLLLAVDVGQEVR